LLKKLPISGSSSLAPQLGHVGVLLSRSRTVMVTVNSFWHLLQSYS
jgi:hypothetical protein